MEYSMKKDLFTDGYSSRCLVRSYYCHAHIHNAIVWSQMAMGTIVTITVDAQSHEKAHNAIQAAFDKSSRLKR
jgi:hypothetical protein